VDSKSGGATRDKSRQNAVHQHQIAAEETIHRHSEAMQRARESLLVIEQVRRSHGTTSAGVTQRHHLLGHNQGCSWAARHADQVTPVTPARQDTLKKAGLGLLPPHVTDGGRGRLFQIGTLKSRAVHPYDPQNVQQQSTYQHLYDVRQDPQPEHQDWRGREDHAAGGEATPRHQIAELQAHIKVLADRSNNLSARLLKNGRLSLHDSGLHASADWQQAAVGLADNMRPSDSVSPSSYESAPVFDSVLQALGVTDDGMQRSSAHHDQGRWSPNRGRGEEREMTESSRSPMLQQMHSQPTHGPNLERNARQRSDQGSRKSSAFASSLTPGYAYLEESESEDAQSELGSAQRVDERRGERGWGMAREEAARSAEDLDLRMYDSYTSATSVESDESYYSRARAHQAHTGAQPPTHTHTPAYAQGPALGARERNHREGNESYERGWEREGREGASSIEQYINGDATERERNQGFGVQEDVRHEGKEAYVNSKSALSIFESTRFTRLLSLCA
jgi:hypothetical protein